MVIIDWPPSLAEVWPCAMLYSRRPGWGGGSLWRLTRRLCRHRGPTAFVGYGIYLLSHSLPWHFHAQDCMSEKITDASPSQLQHSTSFAVLRKISQDGLSNRTFEFLNTDVCSPTEFQMVASMVSLLYTAPSNVWETPLFCLPYQYLICCQLCVFTHTASENPNVICRFVFATLELNAFVLEVLPI